MSEQKYAVTEDWRRSWKKWDFKGREVLFVTSIPDEAGDLIYLFEDEFGNAGVDWYYMTGDKPKSLAPLGPITKKIEMYALYTKAGGKLVSILENEADAIGCCSPGWVIVKLSGELEVTDD